MQLLSWSGRPVLFEWGSLLVLQLGRGQLALEAVQLGQLGAAWPPGTAGGAGPGGWRQCGDGRPNVA
jgi:hypothetical protein